MERGGHSGDQKRVDQDTGSGITRGDRQNVFRSLSRQGSLVLPGGSPGASAQIGGPRGEPSIGEFGTAACSDSKGAPGLGGRTRICNSFGTWSRADTEKVVKENRKQLIKFNRWISLGSRGPSSGSQKELARQWYSWRIDKKRTIARKIKRQEEVLIDRGPSPGKGEELFRGRHGGCDENGISEQGSFARVASIADCPVDAGEAQKRSSWQEIGQRLEQRKLGQQLKLNQFYILSQGEGTCSCCGGYAGDQEEDVQATPALCQKICERNSARPRSRRQAFSSGGLHEEDQFWQAEKFAEMPLPLRSCTRTSAEGGLCQSGIAGDSLPTSFSSGFDRFGLADSLVVDTRCRSFREETLGRGRNQPSACDSICAEHARFGSQHRKLETKRAGQRRRRSRQTDQAWKGRSQRQQAERQQGPNRPVKHQPNCMAAGGQSAKSGLNEPVLDSIRSSWGSFGRFLKLVDKSPGYSDNFEGVGHRTPFHDGKDFALFPSLFVKPSGAHRSKGARSRLRGRGHDISWEWVKVVWAFFTFLEGGQPYKDVDQRALVRKANLVPWTQKHQEYAGYLHDQIHRFVRLKSESEPLSRGILKLDKLIKVVKISQYDGSKFPTDLSNVAKFVEPSRMSLPSEAGIIDPCRFLKDEKLESFKNMPNIIPLDISPDVPTQGCFKVQDKDIHGVYRRLLASGVAALLPERLAVRDPDGNCITGGLFAVDHKPDSDRIILDRRPFNEIERRLVWARLPHGCLLTQLIVPRGWSVRGSGDDLSNYFYLLKHQEAWLPRNAVGKVFDGAGFEEYGGTPGEKYVLTFRVIAMGDLNAVDIAQQVHLEILKDCHCMKEGEVLAFKSPLPASHCFEGLYIDDHVVVQVLPNRKNRTRRQKFRDEDIMDASRTKYGQEGIPISAKKAYTKSKKFVAWGTEVDSESGRVGSPILKLRQLCDIIIAYCRLKSASKKLTQQILGLLIHPLMHRRCMMCLLQECFCWVETLPDKGNTKIPVKVREELLWVGMCLPLCHTDITWPVSCRIGCSDASLSGGGRAATVTTEPVSSTLFRFAEHRGEHVRLDWASGALAPATEMQQVPVEIEELIQDHSWTVTESISFRRKQHINILETKMIHHELVDAVHSCQDGLRCLLLVDSRAAAGAWAKGRSSSKQLNRLLRRSLGWQLACRKSLHLVWVRSEANPSDHPSRGKPIPETRSQPSSISSSILGNDIGFIKKKRRGKDQWKLVHGCTGKKSNKTIFAEPIGDKHIQCDDLDAAVPKPKSRKPLKHENEHPARAHWTFREVFAGTGNLTKAFTRYGFLNVADPVEIMQSGKIDSAHDILNNETYERLCRDASQPHQIWHFAFPCGSFSLLQNLNGGTRSNTEPQGAGCNKNEVKGNEIFHRTLHLCKLLYEHGSFFTMENPLTSYAWRMPLYLETKKSCSITEVVLDQCSYGLSIPDTDGELGLAKKATIFCGNLPGLESLGRRCLKNHKHVQVIGGVKWKGKWVRRSTLAGSYPYRLCSAYHKVCERLFR